MKRPAELVTIPPDPLEADLTAGRSDGLENRTIRGFGWSILGTLSYYFVNLLTLALLARLLSPREFGILAGGVLVVDLASLVIDLGVGPALVQRDKLTDDHAATAFFASLVFGICLALAVALSATQISMFFRVPELKRVIPVLSVLFIMSGISTVSRAYAQRALKFRQLARIRVMTDGILYGVVAISAAVAGASYWSMVLAQLAASAASTVWLIQVSTLPIRRKVRWHLLRDLLKFGGGLSLARVINYFGREGDTLVVARTFDVVSLGIYTRAFRLMVVPATLIGAAVDEVLFPALSRARADKERVEAAIEQGVAGIAIVGIPASICLAILAPEIVRVVLGSGWQAAINPFRVLALGLYFRVGYKFAAAIVHSHGAVYRSALRQSLYAVLVLGGSIFGYRYGLVGVASGVLLALASQFVAMWCLGAKVLGASIWRLIEPHREVVPISAVVGTTIWLTANMLRGLQSPDLVTLLGGIAFGLIAAVAAVKVAPGTFLGRRARWWIEKLGELRRGTSRLDMSAPPTKGFDR